MMWLVLVPFLIGILIGMLAGRPARDTILCTPQDVVEAVLREYNGRCVRPYMGAATVVHVDDPQASAERIAANLIQLVEQKGAGSK